MRVSRSSGWGLAGRQFSSSPGASAALALLVLVVATCAVAAPRALDALVTAGLQREVSALSPLASDLSATELGGPVLGDSSMETGMDSGVDDVLGRQFDVLTAVADTMPAPLRRALDEPRFTVAYDPAIAPTGTSLDNAIEGNVYRKYDDVVIKGSPVTVKNTGNTPTEMTVSVTGIPAVPPVASSDGFSITREYFAVDGTPIDDISQVQQNDRFVVKLTATPQQLGSGQYVIADPLPAGFEIENPNLLGDVGGVGDLSAWLALDTPANVESRTDQYVAAFRIYEKVGTVTTAYLVRAVSPGTFVLPGATVEDMYRPELRGNTDAGHIEIGSSGP